MDKKKCTIIYNPISSNYSQAKLNGAIRILKMHDFSVTAVKSEYSGHVMELVKVHDETSDILVTMGGDGTVSEVIKGYDKIQQHSLYAHISTGTTNDMAVNLGLKRNAPLRNLERLLAGEAGWWDIIYVNDEPISYISSFGEVTHVPYSANTKLKKSIGYAAYIVTAVPAVLKHFKRLNMTVTANGVTDNVDAILGLVMNAGKMAGITLFPYANVSDGKFEVVFLKKIAPKLVAKIFREFLKDDINFTKYPDEIISFTTDELFIDFNGDPPDMPLDNDGNKADFTLDKDNCRLHYRVEKQLKMLFPKKEEE